MVKLRMHGVLVAAAMAAVLGSCPGFAQTTAPAAPAATTPDGPPPPPSDGYGPRRGGPEHRLEMLEQRLALTSEQTAQIKALFASDRSKMDALRANTSLGEEDRRAQMRALHRDSEAKLRALLTPDQVTRYDAMEAQMREHRREGEGPQGPPPPPPPPGL